MTLNTPSHHDDPERASGDTPESFDAVLNELDWIPAQRVHLRAGITVRVRRDAFEGKLGTLHNGRIGEVIAVEGGDVIVHSVERGKPPLVGAHYSPWILEMKLDDCLAPSATHDRQGNGMG